MNTISEVIAPAVSKPYAGYIKDLAAILCGLGVVMAACMATSGLDMSVGFF
jgi:hypothetical protein